MKIIVIGDIILDTNYICNTTRNAPEANIPVYNVIQTSNILGGAGNVAKNLQNLECNVEIVSVIGNDYAGSQVKTLLNDNAIKNKLFTDNCRQTTQKNRVFCNNELVHRYDIEDTYNISGEIEWQIIQYIKSLPELDAIIFSDYNKGVLTQRICEELIAYSRSNHILTFVDPKPAGVLKYKGCFCFKLNLIEGETISCKTSKNDILHYLKTYIECEHVILTCGENGLYVDSIENHICNNFPVEVVDVTGCGDTVLVVISYMYLKTHDIVKSSKIANYVARKCVCVVGNHQICESDIEEFIDTIISDKETHKLTKLAEINKKIVFTNGCFDIIHSAHIRLLQFSKKLGDILIVGINSDSSVKRLKGESRPINDIVERCNVIKNLGIVDYIIVFEDDTPLNILSLIKPHTIVKGGDYKKENIVGAEYAKEIVIYDYISGISSTNTISKITNINSLYNNTIQVMLFDIVIPVGPNDISFIHLLIQYTKQNVIGFRNIYLVSYDDSLIVDGCITISESIYPFSKQDICAVLGHDCRQNWYLQQLLKLYAMFVIPDILNNVLILDSDTFFLKPTRFLDDNNNAIHSYLDENNEPYFSHMNRLHSSLSRIDIEKSGVSHHMMFQKQYLTELFELIQNHHNMDFWKAFVNCIDPAAFSGASEYEIYFNFMLKYHRDKIILREPRYKWIKSLHELQDDYDFVSYHHWYR